MSGTANVLLNNTQRAAIDFVNGEEVTMRSISTDFSDNYVADMGYGAAGFGTGWALGAYGRGTWKPSPVIEKSPCFW